MIERPIEDKADKMTGFYEVRTTEDEIENEPVHGESQKRIETMNDQQLEAKIGKDGDKVKKDINTLVEDSAARLSRVGDNVSQVAGKAKDDLTTWVGDSATRLNEGFEKVKSDAKETVVSTAAAVKQDVGHGLIQYNAKAQEVANKVPGGFGEKAAQYPWVAISVALAVGFLLGILLRPVRRPLG